MLARARRAERTLIADSSEIAKSLANNPVQVRRNLAHLRAAGLVSVTGRGPGAGWTITRSADTISLSEVYDALGETGPFALHAHDPNPECTVGAGIRPVLTSIYAEALDAMIRELGTRTIADVLDEILANDPVELTADAARS